jgi:hypothetical protein
MNMKNSQKGFAPIVIVLLFVVVIGGVYYILQSKKTDDQTNIINQDSRTVLSHSMYSSKLMDGVKNMNVATPTDSVLYKDPGFGITLPYNPQWGNETYKLAPFETYKDSSGKTVVVFGPIAVFEGGYLIRSGNIKVVPFETKAALVKKHNTGMGEEVVYQGTVNDNDVVIVGEGSFQTFQMYIVGFKNNLEIRYIPFGTYENIDYLLSIAESVHFIKSDWSKHEIMYEDKVIDTQDIPVMLVQKDTEFEVGKTGQFKDVKFSPDGAKAAFSVTNGVHDFGWVYDFANSKFIPLAFQYGGGVDVIDWKNNNEVTLRLRTPKPSTSEVTFNLNSLPEYPKLAQ